MLSYGAITIDAVARATLVGTVRSDPPPTQLPADDATRVSAFASHLPTGEGWYFGGFDYGTPTNHSTQAAASAQMNGRGFGELGVSGRSEGPSADSWGLLGSSLFAEQRVTNTGDQGEVRLDYTTPLIEIAQYGNRFNGLVAQIVASLFISRYDALGTFVENLPGFLYALDFNYVKPPTTYAIQTYTASADLLRDSAGLVDVELNGCSVLGPCTGMAIQPFSVSRSLGELNAGDYLQYNYYMNAFLVTGREGGGHALYGDPLAFSGGSGRNFFEFSAVGAPAATVPEPSSWALCGAAIAALAWRRRALRVR